VLEPIVAVSLLQYVAVCCSMVQYVAVREKRGGTGALALEWPCAIRLPSHHKGKLGAIRLDY